MGFKDISIKSKFIILTGLVAMALIIVSCVGYFHTDKALKESVNTEVIVTMQHAAIDMDDWLAQRIAVAQSQATLMSNFNGDYNRIKAKENMSLASYDKFIVDMGIGLEDGTFTSYALGLTKLDPRTRDWYKDMKSSSSAYNVTEPYVDSNTNQTLVSIIAPIKNGNNFIGAVCEDIALDVLVEKVNAVKYHDVGTATFMSNDGTIIATSTPEFQGAKNIKDVINLPEQIEKMRNESAGNFELNVGGGKYVFGYARIPSTNWIVGINVPYSAAFGVLSSLAINFTVITIICLVIITYLCLKISNAITDPILQLEEHAKQLSQGNLRINDIVFDGTDEIGSLTQAFNTMSGNLRKLINKMLTTSEQLAASSEELTASSTQSANTAVHVAETVAEVGGEITQQMKDIEGAKDSIDVVSGDIQIVADKATRVASTSESTAKAAQTGEQLMQEAISKMNSIEKSVLASAEVVERLGESSKQIGQIVEAISEIADQTNLLALNAAIEAARAGEHGRGFAVVSEEVRKLATASQESAEQIRARIESIQASTEEAVVSMKNGTQDVVAGTNAIKEVGLQFKEIMRMVDGIKDEITGINQSVKTVSDGAAQIVQAVDSIAKASRTTDQRTQAISSDTETQSASNEEIAAAAQALSHLAEDMQVAIGKFKV